VHYFSAQMAERPDYREREERFLDNPQSELPAAAWDALEAIAARTQLDYFGIDFGLDRAGALVVFECNATMAVRPPPEAPMWSYRRPAADAIRRAVHEMLQRYSSA
jgi:ketosteroid isomerase-like protein